MPFHTIWLSGTFDPTAGVAGALASPPMPDDVAVPDDLAAAFDAPTRRVFDRLSPSHRRQWLQWIDEIKKPETRAARIGRTVESLRPQDALA